MFILDLCNLDHSVEDGPPRRKSEPPELKKCKCEGHKTRAVAGFPLSDENLKRVRDVQSPKHIWNALKTFSSAILCFINLSLARTFTLSLWKMERECKHI